MTNYELTKASAMCFLSLWLCLKMLEKNTILWNEKAPSLPRPQPLTKPALLQLATNRQSFRRHNIQPEDNQVNRVS